MAPRSGSNGHGLDWIADASSERPNTILGALQYAERAIGFEPSDRYAAQPGRKASCRAASSAFPRGSGPRNDRQSRSHPDCALGKGQRLDVAKPGPGKVDQRPDPGRLSLQLTTAFRIFDSFDRSARLCVSDLKGEHGLLQCFPDFPPPGIPEPGQVDRPGPCVCVKYRRFTAPACMRARDVRHFGLLPWLGGPCRFSCQGY
ncbi:hypothetical protein ACVILK_006150 [Bradyrhizobium embrapense]